MRWLTWRAISARPYAKSDQAKSHHNALTMKATVAADVKADPSIYNLAGGSLRTDASCTFDVASMLQSNWPAPVTWQACYTLIGPSA